MPAVKKTPKPKRKGIRARRIKPAQEIVPSDYEIETVTVGLSEYYDSFPDFLKGKSKEDKIAEVIEKAKKGWKCAANAFVPRVELLTKWNSAGIKNLFGKNDNYKAAQQIRAAKEIREVTKKISGTIDKFELAKLLTGEEKKIFLERHQVYVDEFEMNESSDWSLLMQVLLEELRQYRLAKRSILYPEEDIEMALNESYKRLIKAQESLGVTRHQRENANKEAEGNIAQLVKLYEEKKAFIEKQKKLDLAEEEDLMAKHDSGEVYNLLVKDGMKDMGESLLLAKQKEEEMFMQSDLDESIANEFVPEISKTEELKYKKSLKELEKKSILEEANKGIQETQKELESNSEEFRVDR